MLASTLYGAEAAAGQRQDGFLPDGGDLGLDRDRDELLEEGQQRVVQLRDAGVLQRRHQQPQTLERHLGIVRVDALVAGVQLPGRGVVRWRHGRGGGRHPGRLGSRQLVLQHDLLLLQLVHLGLDLLSHDEVLETIKYFSASYQIFSVQPDMYWLCVNLSTLSGSRCFRLMRQTEMIVGI